MCSFNTVPISCNASPNSPLTLRYAYGIVQLIKHSEFQVEIKQNNRFKKRNKATATNLQIYKSGLVKRSHQPDFNYTANFLLNKENFCLHNKLVVGFKTVFCKKNLRKWSFVEKTQFLSKNRILFKKRNFSCKHRRNVYLKIALKFALKFALIKSRTCLICLF